jgi:hypothetical protein
MIGNDGGVRVAGRAREIDPLVGWAKFAALAERTRRGRSPRDGTARLSRYLEGTDPVVDSLNESR